MICQYGCKQKAKYQLKNGKWCCSDNISKCSEISKKIGKTLSDSTQISCPKCSRKFKKYGLVAHFKYCDGRTKNFCLECGKEISFENNKKFCNCSCSAFYNNRKGIGRSIHISYCKNCGKVLRGWNRKFCNNKHKCMNDYKYKENVKKWVDGEIGGGSLYRTLSFVRRYLIKKFDGKCAECGWRKVNPYTKTIPLEIHHIDRNPYNNKPENLTLLCGACHSLTKGYRGNNVGKGKREYRKKYY